MCLSLCLEFPRMPDENARQKAEDHYYAALDLMADGQLEKAVAAYHESLAADPTFTEAMHGLARALQDLQRSPDSGERIRHAKSKAIVNVGLGRSVVETRVVGVLLLSTGTAAAGETHRGIQCVTGDECQAMVSAPGHGNL